MVVRDDRGDVISLCRCLPLSGEIVRLIPDDGWIVERILTLLDSDDWDTPLLAIPALSRVRVRALSLIACEASSSVMRRIIGDALDFAEIGFEIAFEILTELVRVGGATEATKMVELGAAAAIEPLLATGQACPSVFGFVAICPA
jgi:hypothetical protein